MRITPTVRTWTGAVDNIWTDAANWTNNAAPGPGDDLVFPATATRFTVANNFPIGTSFGSITIESAGYVLVGNALTLTSGISATFTSGSATDNIDTDLGSGGVSVASGGRVDLGGAISGSAGLNLTGGGTLALTRSTMNVYTGTSTVTDGTLLLAKDNAAVAVPGPLVVGDGGGTDLVQLLGPGQIATGAPVTVNSSGTLDLNGYSNAIGSLTMTAGTVTTGAGVLTLGGDVTTNTANTPSTISGQLDLGGAVRQFSIADPAAATDAIISAVISGTGAGLVKTGTGNLVLGGANTFDGAVAVNQGLITLTNGAALGSAAAGTTVASGAEITVEGGIDLGAEPLNLGGTGLDGQGALQSLGGSNRVGGPVTLTADTAVNVSAGSLDFAGSISDGVGPFALTKNGPGTLTLSAANTYQGQTTVSAGVLEATDSAALGTTAAGTTVASGAALVLKGDVSVGAEALSLAGDGPTGAGALQSVSGANSWAGDIALTAATSVGVDAGHLTVSGAVTGSFGLMKRGAGTLQWAGTTANSYSGSTTVLGGTLELNKTAAVAVPAGLTIGDGTTPAAVQLLQSGQTSASADVTILSGSSLDLNGFDDTIASLTLTGASVTTGAGVLTLGGDVTVNADASTSSVAGQLDLGGADRTFTVADGASATDLDVAATVSGTGGVIKAGPGTMLLSGSQANTYTGATAVNGGTLVLDDAGGNAIPGNLTIGNAVVRLDAPDQIGDSTVVSLSGGSLLDLNGNNDQIGGLDLTGATVATGSAVLGISGGVTTHASSNESLITGTLDLTGGNRTVDVASGGLPVDLGITAVIQNGGLTKTGAGVLALSGDNTYTGPTDIQTGTVQVGSDNALGTGPGEMGTTVAPGTSLVITGSNLNIPEVLTISGTGSTPLGAIANQGDQNTLSGPITLVGDASLGSLAGDTLFLNGVISDSGGNYGLTVDSQALSPSSFGTVVLGGANTFNGSVHVTAGALVATNDSALGSTLSGTAVDGGASLALAPAVQIGNESFVLGGSGADGNGGLRSLGGTTGIAGDVLLATDTLIGVDGGTLTLSGAVSGSAGVTKAGPGELAYTGTTSNTYNGATRVNDGTLTLGKTNGAFAFGGGPSAGLFIGDGTGADTVRLQAPGQIPGTTPVTINGKDAVLDLNGNDSTVGPLDFTGGTVTTGAGTLTLGGDVTVNAGPDHAAISGHVDLGGQVLIFGVADTSDPVDLDVQATVASTGGGFLKTGTGVMSLGAANSYDGPTSVIGGSLVVHDPAGLGATTKGTAVGEASSLVFQLPDTSVVNEPIVLGDGGVTFTPPTLQVASGTGIAFRGGVTLNDNANVDVAPGLDVTVDTNPVLEVGLPRSLNKLGAGRLVLATDNSYGGATNIQAGMLGVGSSLATGVLGQVSVAGGASLDVETPLYLLPSGGLSLAAGSHLLTTAGGVTVVGTGTLTGNVTVDSGGGTLDLNVPFGETGGSWGLTKSGAGLLILTGSSTYSGLTTAAAGTLRVSGQVAGPVSLDPGTTLGGTGTVGAVTSVGGTISPGNSPGVIHTGDLSLDSTSLLNAELDGNTPGNYDQVVVTGTVNLGGAVLALSLGGGYTPTIGDQLVLVDNDGTDPIAGTFAGLPEGSLITLGGSTFRISYLGTDAATGNDVVLTTVAATTTGVTANPGSTTYGQSVTFTATVSSSAGTPTGSVVFFDNGTPLSGSVGLDPSGVATLTTSTLAAGNHTITVDYTGSGNFQSSTGGLAANPFVVSAASTTTVVSGSTPTSVYGQSVILSALVSTLAPGSGTPVGQVAFFDNGVPIGTAAVNNLGLAALTVSTLSAAGSPHPITAIFTSSQGNYLSSFAPTPFFETVQKATLTVTADAQSRTYGAGNPSLTATITGFVNGETLATSGVTGAPDLATPAVATSPVGNYAITAAAGNLAAGNYDFTFVDGSLAVTKAHLTVTADPQSRLYGSTNPTLTATVTGFVNGENLATSGVTGAPGLNTAAVATSPVGNYAITAGAGDLAANNYDFTFVDGDLAVTKAHLTVTADPQSRQYGDPNPGLTATVTGFVNGEDLATSGVSGAAGLVTTAGTASPVGGYTITASAGTLAANNYDFGFVDGTLTVTKALLTVTADTLARSYGASNPALTATFTGFKNGENLATSGVTGSPDLNTPAVPGSPVGTYPITAAGGTLSAGNYDFAFADGSLVVTKAHLVVTADPQTRTYGDPNPALTATVTGFVNGENLASSGVSGAPVLNTAAVPTSPVGTYAITVSAGTLAAGNYDFLFSDGSLLITKALLVVSGDGVSRLYGSPNPALTFAITGYKNGENLASSGVTGAPSVSTPATPGSPVSGNPYAVNVSAGSLAAANYAFSFVNGVLSVTPAPLTVTADNASRVFGAIDPTFTASYGGFVNGDTPADLTTPVVLATTAGASSPVGQYPITASGATSENYVITFVNGLLSVDRADTAAVLNGPVQTPVFGQSMTITATVSAVSPGSGHPTGFVSFASDGTPLGTVAVDPITGLATVSVSGLAVGTHVISAQYLGDGNFNAAGAPALNQAVAQASTSTTVSGPATTLFGQTATFTATVTVVSPGQGLPTGSVWVYDGTDLLGTAPVSAGGQATFSTSSLGTGAHSVTAVYQGDAQFAASTSPVASGAVQPASVLVTGLAVGNTVAFGQPVLVSATVSAVAPGAGLPGGTVQLTENGQVVATASLAGGTATFVANGLGVGTHQFGVQYVGSTDFAPGAAATMTSVVVTRASSTVTVSSTTTLPDYGQSVTFTAVVGAAVGTPGGTVTFRDGSNGPVLAVVPVSNGVARYTTPALVGGSHAVTAAYSGDTDHAGSSAAASLYVMPAATLTSLVSSSPVAVTGQAVVYTASVAVNAPGAGAPAGVVVFYDGATFLGVAPVVNGKASLATVAFNGGQTHSIIAVYTGNANFQGSPSLRTPQVVLPASTVSTLTAVHVGRPGSGLTQYNAVVRPVAPGSGTPGGFVTFYIGSRPYQRVALVNGHASLTLSGRVTAGRPVRIAYGGSSDYAASHTPGLAVGSRAFAAASRPFGQF